MLTPSGRWFSLRGSLFVERFPLLPGATVQIPHHFARAKRQLADQQLRTVKARAARIDKTVAPAVHTQYGDIGVGTLGEVAMLRTLYLHGGVDGRPADHFVERNAVVEDLRHNV